MAKQTTDLVPGAKTGMQIKVKITQPYKVGDGGKLRSICIPTFDAIVTSINADSMEVEPILVSDC